ncbi:hypothetical protein DFH07DRAFT_829717 [Mycena maculata]|uniref:Uncharacterized protein n=1 Tax=Mycena maculata TaxID=230809 RepID=A0AAD7N7P1_9AGAR|nr:hypothetical protein DFH07DRAFT_829717 [Mycena maculata]
MPAALFRIDRPPSSLGFKRAFSGTLAFRIKLPKNKATILAPIIELEEPEPGEDETREFEALRETSVRACPSMKFADPIKPLHLDFRCAVRKPLHPANSNKQTTPTVEFTSLALTEEPERNIHCSSPSSLAVGSNMTVSMHKPRRNIDTIPAVGEIPRSSGRRIPALDPGCGRSGLYRPGGCTDSVLQTSHGPGKRMREPEVEERYNAKRRRMVLNDETYPQMPSDPGIPTDTPMKRRNTPPQSNVRALAALPRRSILPYEKTPREGARKRTFQEVEHGVDEVVVDTLRYVKRRALC